MTLLFSRTHTDTHTYLHIHTKDYTGGHVEVKVKEDLVFTRSQETHKHRPRMHSRGNRRSHTQSCVHTSMLSKNRHVTTRTSHTQQLDRGALREIIMIYMQEVNKALFLTVNHQLEPHQNSGLEAEDKTLILKCKILMNFSPQLIMNTYFIGKSVGTGLKLNS